MDTVLVSYEDNPENRQRLFDFYNLVYPGAPWLLDVNRFIWQNLSNPLLPNGKTAIWLLYDQDENIIGQNIYINYNLSIDKKIYYGNCSTNLIVKPGIVGKGFGHKMIERNESLDGVAYAVGITPASTRAFLKRGWVLVEDAKLMSKIINPIPNLRYVGWPKWKIILLSPVMKCFNYLFDFYAALKGNDYKDVTCRELDRFTPEMDQYWSDYLSDYAIHFERSHTTLNYKYNSRDDVQHTKLLFEQNGKPVGYLVYRLSHNPVKKITLGRIVDYVYDPALGDSFFRYLLKIAIGELKAKKVDGIVGIASNEMMVKAYKDNGIFFSRVQPAIIKEKGFDISALRNKFKTLWYITLGDSDLDNYW